MSEPVGAEEALRLGIANQVVAPDELDDTVQRYAERIASGPSVALRYMKRNLNAAESGPLSEVLDLEALGHTRTGMTDDHREAAQAFVDKREPVFRGT